MPERIDATSRLLIEKRCEVYSDVAALIMDLEEALERDEGNACRGLLRHVRRTLRCSLAFLTDEVYQELERLEALTALLPPEDSEGPIPSSLHGDLADRLQLLHVKLARALQLPQLQDMVQIVGLPPRLKHMLAEESLETDARARRREIEEQCWILESEARELIRIKAYPKAIKSLKKAIRLDGTRAVFHNDLGVVLSLLGHNGEAVEEYRSAVALNESYPASRTDEWATSYYNLGIALRKVALKAEEERDEPAALEGLREAQRAFLEYVRQYASGPKAQEARLVLEQLAVRVDQLASRAQEEPEPA